MSTENNSKPNEPEIERPLSPVLNSSKPKLFGRRKIRINLNKRFEKPKQIQDFSEESFSLPENEDLINCLDRLEKIEENREAAYKVLISTRKSDLTFKKPISPAPKRFKSCNSPSKLETQQVYSEKISIVKQLPIELELPTSSNFQTATGKTINITETNLQKHSQLFEDILNCSQSEFNHKNKYNFLKKPTSESLTQEILDSGISNTQILSAVDNALNKVQSLSIDGFTGFDRKEINLCEKRKLETLECIINKKFKQDSFFNATNLNLDKEFMKINSDNSNFSGGLKLEKVLGFSSASGKKLSVQTDSLLKAKNTLEDLNLDEEFMKINSEESVEKDSKLLKSNLVSSSASVTLSIPTNSLAKAENSDFIEISKLGKDFGFSSASGKKLSVQTDSLVKAKNVFEDLNVDEKFMKINSEKSVEKDLKLLKSNLASSSASVTNLSIPTNSLAKAENSDFIEISKLGKDFGFSSASGKKLSVQTNSLVKAKNVFEDLNLDEEFMRINSKKSVDDKLEKDLKPLKSNLASTSVSIRTSIPTNSAKAEDFNNIFTENSNFTGNSKLGTNFGFSSASGKKLSVQTDSLVKAKNVFEDLNLDEEFMKMNSETSVEDKLEKDLKLLKSNLASVRNLSNPTNSLTKGEEFTKIEDKKSDFNGRYKLGTDFGFSSASGNKLSVQTDSFVKAKNIFEDLNLDGEFIKINSENSNFSKQTKPNEDFKSIKNISNKQISTSKEMSENNSHNGVKDKLKYFDQLIGDDCDFSPQKSVINPNPRNRIKNKLDFFENSTPIKNLNVSGTTVKKSKRQLGVSSCKQISIPESKLHKAKMLFDDEFSPIKPPNFTSYSTPVKNDLKNLKNVIPCSTPVKTDIQRCHIYSNLYKINENEIKLKDDSLVTFKDPVDGNFEIDVREEIQKLEDRLMVVKTRQESFEQLKKEKSDCDKKPKQGVLYKSKMEKNRIPLKKFIKEETMGQNFIDDLFCITPQNATKIHFKESSAGILTTDGASVLPNIKDLIGLSEIEFSFKAMQGIDPELIPKGWIKNHYKWIIWKLVSYERMFHETFKGCLSVEQVMQQLKYRYDREIDKAERSALRKILEKDDAPQKRMVLCISDIKKMTPTNFELELTDGWYGIRTLIDEPLCHQILTGKLRIGTKLVISGAELMNCDGCHPLDVTDLSFLKINFNSTRRAKWDTKLGYQKYPGPFSVAVHTVRPNGGIIGSIEICVARVYPLRYFDKSENRSVWRNKKAEEIRAQEWENERYKKLEKIEEDVRNEFTKNYNKDNKTSDKTSAKINISNIACPKILLELLETSKDPDTIQDSMTPDQKSALMDYKRNVLQAKQQEMVAKMKDSAEKLKMVTRDVTAVLKLLVVDLNGSPTHSFNFFLWRPTESHVQLLKEESCFTVYNVLPKLTGDLYASTKTVFKEKQASDHMSAIFKRKLIPIGDLDDLKFSKNFSDFDTVGIVVDILVQSDSQEMWLCDISGRLLLVDVFESTSTCALFDTLKRGQVTSGCNLTYRGVKNDICRASANHFSIFSSYPKYKHLQNGLDGIKKDLPKNLNGLLEDCDSKIRGFNEKRLTKSSIGFSFDDNDDTLTNSRITSTDIALSLIDIDKFT